MEATSEKFKLEKGKNYYFICYSSYCPRWMDFEKS